MRGTISQVSDGQFMWQYYDVSQPDTHYGVLHAQGFQGGGPSWAGIIYGLLKLRAPELLERIDFDPEGDGLAIWSTDPDLLRRIGDLVEEVKANPSLMASAIGIAVQDDQME